MTHRDLPIANTHRASMSQPSGDLADDRMSWWSLGSLDGIPPGAAEERLAADDDVDEDEDEDEDADEEGEEEDEDEFDDEGEDDADEDDDEEEEAEGT